MKNSIHNTLICFMGTALIISLFAFSSPPPSYEYMTFSTVESIVPGGLGRSRMLIQNGTGNLQEIKLRNLYSIVGIKMANIYENDQTIMSKINELNTQGWELMSANPGVQTPNLEGSNGIYLTRYILRRVK